MYDAGGRWQSLRRRFPGQVSLGELLLDVTSVGTSPRAAEPALFEMREWV